MFQRTRREPPEAAPEPKSALDPQEPAAATAPRASSRRRSKRAPEFLRGSEVEPDGSGMASEILSQVGLGGHYQPFGGALREKNSLDPVGLSSGSKTPVA